LGEFWGGVDGYGCGKYGLEVYPKRIEERRDIISTISLESITPDNK
jgi:hypothetical protein